MIFAFAGAAESFSVPDEGVSRELARARARQIFSVRYRLKFTIAPAAESLQGQAEIIFSLKTAPTEIVLDFRDQDANGKITNGKIEGAAVNDAPADFRQINGHIVFAGKNFKTGENKITLGFASKIAAANRPFVRFIDAGDGGEYVYSLFTPADASMAFPCFDQPDLKGRFSLEIIAPEK